MATAVQNAIEVWDQSFLHLGLIKILVQYQLSINGKNWDQFLAKNDLVHNEFWPSFKSKTLCKRRKSSVFANPALGSNLTLEKLEVRNQISMQNLGNTFGKDECSLETLVSQPEHIQDSPMKNPEELADVCFTKTKEVHKRSILEFN